MWQRGNYDPEGPYGKGWKKKRARILRRDGYRCQCDDCRITGNPRPATEVDHKVPVEQGGTNDDSNLQAINGECHKRKTKLDEGKQPGYGCTDTGFPLDPRHPWAQQRREQFETLKRKHEGKKT
jgi:5-methylcytosine-specific restriction protein A